MDLLMIAFGLSMDAFAVSTTNGMCVSRQQTNRFFGKALSWSAMFGLFQGLMPLLGYFLGRAFSEFISSIDHWVAFVLLAFIGGKMVWEAVHPEEDEDACDTSLSFAAILTQAVAKQMIGQEPLNGRKGVIVNVSSCSAEVSSISRGEYCVSKAGVSMLTKLYADRLAGEGILVHEVRPGVIATDMTSTVQEKYDKLIRDGLFPIARWGTPQDVADAVSALCSDKFLYTTGNYIDVDGGFHIKRL